VETGTEVQAKLKDSRRNDVTTLALTTDEFGMVKGEYLLGDEPTLGSYQIELTIGAVDENDRSNRFQQQVKVEEYEKPEYKVDVSQCAMQL